MSPDGKTVNRRHMKTHENAVKSVQAGIQDKYSSLYSQIKQTSGTNTCMFTSGQTEFLQLLLVGVYHCIIDAVRELKLFLYPSSS